MRALIATLLLALLAALPATAKPVMLGTEGAFPPYTFLDSSGVLTGFDIDMGNALCDRAGLECDWVINDWDSIIPNLLAGRYDAIIAAMAATPERREQVAFSQGYETEPALSPFVGKRSGIDPATATIAVQSNTIHEVFLRARGYSVVTYPTAAAAVQAVLDDKADLVFGSGLFLESRVTASGRRLVIVAREQIDAGPTSIAFRKDDVALRERFDEALDAMIADGSLAALRAKWFAQSADL